MATRPTAKTTYEGGATPETLVVLAGATGDRGGRIAEKLISRGASVRILMRTDGSAAGRDRVASLGATTVSADVTDVASVAEACQGAACVVCAWSGLRDVILDRQTVLLDAAVRSGVPRFISSDYSEDYTKTATGHNRNLDLRREFMGRADRAPIRVTSILNGAFMDMLGAEMPIVQPRIRRVLYWGDAHQPLYFTTRDDTAAALDDTTPRALRIAGDTVTVRDIARLISEASGKTYRTLWAGSLGTLGAMVPIARLLAPEKPDAVFLAWQGMQYMMDMYSGAAKLEPLDNDRYPDLRWTSLLDRFIGGHLPGGTA